MHPKATYYEFEARDVLNHVRSFLTELNNFVGIRERRRAKTVIIEETLRSYQKGEQAKLILIAATRDR